MKEGELSLVFRPFDIERHLEAVVALAGVNGKAREFNNRLVDGYADEPEGMMVVMEGHEHKVVGFMWLTTSGEGKPGKVHFWSLAKEWQGRGVEEKMEGLAEAYFRRKGVVGMSNVKVQRSKDK